MTAAAHCNGPRCRSHREPHRDVITPLGFVVRDLWPIELCACGCPACRAIARDLGAAPVVEVAP